MDLPKKRSSRYVTGVYAVFIILFAFTVSLFYTSRCEQSPRISDLDRNKIKPKRTTEIVPKVTGKIDTAKEQLGKKNNVPHSKNIIDDETIIIPPPKKEAADQKKIVNNDLKTLAEEDSTMISKTDKEDLKIPSAEDSAGSIEGTIDNLKIPSEENSDMDTKDTNKIPPKSGVLPANQKMIIYFSKDSTGLTSKARAKLKAIADFLLNNPDTGIIVEGYGDSDRSYRHNQKLSQVRAEIVMSYFVRKGIDIARIKAYWMGSENPADSQDSQKNRNKTHQVEIKYK